jgi:cellulose 1,4-beta-cellobiosidase
MFKYGALLAFVSLVPAALGQVQAWGQCGGINYSGSTTCASGTACVKINDYYFQCQPGATAAPPASSTIVTSATSKPPTSTGTGPTSTATGTTPVPTGTTGNPYTGKSVYVSPYYADEVAAAAASITDSALKAKYSAVAKVPTFIWFDVIAKVPTLETYLKDAQAKKQLLQIVVYDLPDRDCAAKASNGEFAIANGGLAKYKGYIDQMVTILKKYPDVTVVAVVEPDSLANIVTNLNVAKCAGAQEAYKAGVTYAMQQLNTVGVYMYLDAGHAGWLGWPANLTPAAKMFADLYKAAGSPKFVRGLATNVANYNALSAASPDPVTQGNSNYDEIHYINALGPALTSAGFPAQFIVDQGRSGKQNIRQAWGNWCNVKGAGFGTRPTTSTGSSLIDAIVWVKPGGESDGTSDSSATRYDSMCGQSDAAKPAPEAGNWFQTYFNDLVVNASPEF